MYFWRNYAKIVSKFLKSYFTRLSHEPISRSRLLFQFTAPQSSDKCWSNLLLQCHIFLIGNTQRSCCITSTIIWFILWLVCLEPATTCWRWSIITWRHHCTVPAYKTQGLLILIAALCFILYSGHINKGGFMGCIKLNHFKLKLTNT